MVDVPVDGGKRAQCQFRTITDRYRSLRVFLPPRAKWVWRGILALHCIEYISVFEGDS
jgi:hypothetical protein